MDVRDKVDIRNNVDLRPLCPLHPLCGLRTFGSRTCWRPYAYISKASFVILVKISQGYGYVQDRNKHFMQGLFKFVLVATFFVETVLCTYIEQKKKRNISKLLICLRF